MISLNNKPEDFNAMNKNTLMEALGIEYLEVKEGFVRARMPVDHRTLQPFDILHGGASLALAETIASMGSAVLVDLSKYDVRGAAVTANHIGAAKNGFVTGEARILHKGKITHVWDVKIKDGNGSDISLARVTMVVVKKSNSK